MKWGTSVLLALPLPPTPVGSCRGSHQHAPFPAVSGERTRWGGERSPGWGLSPRKARVTTITEYRLWLFPDSHLSPGLHGGWWRYFLTGGFFQILHLTPSRRSLPSPWKLHRKAPTSHPSVWKGKLSNAHIGPEPCLMRIPSVTLGCLWLTD